MPSSSGCALMTSRSFLVGLRPSRAVAVVVVMMSAAAIAAVVIFLRLWCMCLSP